MKPLTRTSACDTLFLVVLCSCLLFYSPGVSSSPQSALLRNTIRGLSPDHQKQSAPSLIEYFEAHTLRSGIELVWGVFSEKDIDGFRIYRMSESDASLVVVNKQGLIPAWHQSFVDTDLAPSTHYRYVLGVVFEDDTEYLSEPVEARSSEKTWSLSLRVLANAANDHPK